MSFFQPQKPTSGSYVPPAQAQNCAYSRAISHSTSTQPPTASCVPLTRETHHTVLARSRSSMHELRVHTCLHLFPWHNFWRMTCCFAASGFLVLTNITASSACRCGTDVREISGPGPFPFGSAAMVLCCSEDWVCLPGRCLCNALQSSPSQLLSV
jgi:hypothetical protein